MGSFSCGCHGYIVLYVIFFYFYIYTYIYRYIVSDFFKNSIVSILIQFSFPFILFFFLRNAGFPTAWKEIFCEAQPKPLPPGNLKVWEAL